jgi:hypothetical protein
MEVNGRPKLKIEVAEQKLMYVSLSMTLGVVSQFGDFQCIGDLIRGLRLTIGSWEVASGKWQVAIEPTCMSLR